MRLEWPTLGLIVMCYGLWLAAGIWLWPVLPVAALALMAVMAALHSSLVHECLHGHPTRNRLVNEALVTLPLSLAYPYRRYKATHLQHHNDARLTDPFDDPESYYRARWQYDRLPGWLKSVLRVNNALLGRVILGPWLVVSAFFLSEAQGVLRGDKGVRLAWGLHLVSAGLVLVAVNAMGIPLWLYVLGVCWPALSLIAVRTFAEHRWHDDAPGRTIIVERSPLAWLFLFNNLHIVHHTMPTAPWYQLPRLYRERRAEWHRLNGGYAFDNYTQIWRNWGLRIKEPVVHPVLRQEPDQ
ncbi:MAG: fatty acid desaturase [Paracoccaceae bacterium]